MKQYALPLRDANITEAIELLERGTELMGDMAELRLPRNSKANGIYDKEVAPEPARADEMPGAVITMGRDLSSVGRLKEKIEAVVVRMTKRPHISLV
ncbi:MAG: hypothetical protein ACOYNL_00875 [Rickettsiales bacterium]